MPAPDVMGWIVGLVEFVGGLGMLAGAFTPVAAGINALNVAGLLVLGAIRGSIPDPLPGGDPLPGFREAFLILAGHLDPRAGRRRDLVGRRVLDPREVGATQAVIAGSRRTRAPGSNVRRLEVWIERLQALVDVAKEPVSMAVGARGRGIGLHDPAGRTKRVIRSQSSSAPTPTAATYAAPRQEPGWPCSSSIGGRAHRRRSASRRGCCAPPSEAITRRTRVAQLLEHLDMVAKAEHDGLERRPPDVAERVVQPEADQRAAGVGVVDRGLLAEEVGQEDQPVGAGRQLRRPGDRGAGAAVSPAAAAASASAPAKVRTIQFSSAPEQAMQPFGMNRPGTMW